ncbi:DUF951 domain-containing protein [Anaerolineae bacterium CFX9]|jgi:hypothetical protein|nr:DUF951 domain-containing protein [Oscillatoria laete-virens]MDL1900960.1 DUF951 domain-containing protein [Anaerolineae bacterium CFX9]MDL5054572.1 DUF951 domain-containing protein [Oscillatoria laete-virens NRMC-F 0139]
MTSADVAVGDQVRLRKPHACGGDTWEVYRVGADIGLRCLSCGHRVMLVRSVFARQMKKNLTAAARQGEDG